MSLYTISDLHLSLGEAKKSMEVFPGWENYVENLEKNWISTVSEDDSVVICGDISWAMNLEEAVKDFGFLNYLPGEKIILKGNHDYWWNTVTSMKKFLYENNIQNIDFLYNNSFEVEGKIICGTRGWSLSIEDTVQDQKIIDREVNRLNLSIEDAISKYGTDKEIIAILHYPPITQSNIVKNETTPFIQMLREYGIKKCYYGHLHGLSIKDAVNGNVSEIELHLISADGVDFKLQEIKE